ncbi:MAG: ATP-binding protein, partial [Acidimicrobiales bacterium]
MQRRLTIALTLTALVSIVLVGFGVLAMAQLGARSSAEDQVRRGLNVVADFLGNSDRSNPQIEALLLGSRRDLGLDFAEPVLIGDDGTVVPLPNRQRRRGPQAPPPLPSIQVGEGQLNELDGGETVVVSVDQTVFGIRLLTTEGLVRQSDLRPAVIAGQRVSAVSRQAVAWFLLSSAIVLVGALVAGTLLARRLTGPIKAIKSTTAAIAGGDLGARVEATGNDEMADLGHAVNQMAADLQRSKALDRQFLMSISHDLKTPLTAIAGYAEGLSDGAVTDPRAAGDVIGNHARRLDRLVGDLLDLARLDANRFRLNIRGFDLSVVAGRTVAGLVNQAGQHGITLTRTGVEAAVVSADSDRTAQAIANLIDNAIKFARSRIDVAVEVGEDWAMVSVSDDGPGIAEADLPHIFDRLYTGAAQPQRAENPTGLGLAIVRELTHAMGGHVAAGNNTDGGAWLRLALPRVRAGGAEPAAGQLVGPGSS